MRIEHQDFPALVHTDETMTKVNDALASLGLDERDIETVVDALQSRGIFFRERSEKTIQMCGRKNCSASFMGDREGNDKAWRDGWFLQKWGGPVWCPIHIPEWVGSSFVRQKEQE
jgi:hypothetical protein